MKKPSLIHKHAVCIGLANLVGLRCSQGAHLIRPTHPVALILVRRRSRPRFAIPSKPSIMPIRFQKRLVCMASIQILVGSVMGTAETVAEAVAAELRQLHHEVKVNFQADIADVLQDEQEILLLCTSNTGSGDLPDNIQSLYLQLTRDYPRIAGRRYGVINLGDSSYATFNEGGRALDAAFEDLGAQRIGEPLVVDACDGLDAEEEAIVWVKSWVTLL